MRGHEFPKPMWNDRGEIEYAPNGKDEEKLKAQGYRTQPVTRPFPMALHAAPQRIVRKDSSGVEIVEWIPQTVSVKNQDELERALKNGWKLKPVIDEQPIDEPPSPDRPPIGFNVETEMDEPEAGEPTKRPGRPRKETTAA